jgi:hypothetical protein
VGPHLENGRGARPLAFLVGGLLLSTLILSAALAAVALRRAPVLVVPGVRDSQILVPGQIPDAAARKFAFLYLTTLEDYTPSTVEDRSNYLLRFVAPELLERAAKELSDRATYAIRAKESSHVTIPSSSLSSASGVARSPGGLLHVSVVAERRIWIASEPKSTGRFRYVLDLRPSVPTDEDAFGFVVVGQSISKEPEVAEPQAGREDPHGHP